MRSHRRSTTIAAIVALVLAACGGTGTPAQTDAGPSTASSSGTGARTIKIGFAAPLSGEQAYYGQSLLDGVEYGADRFEFSGALAGSTVELVALDDAADPAQGVTVAQRFIAEGFDGVVANFNSGVTMATMPIYNEARMPQVTASSSPDISKQGFDNVAQVMGNDNNQGEVMADFVADDLNVQAVAIFDDSQTFGQGVARTFADAAEANGIKIVDRVSLNPQSQDFRGSISPVLEKNPEAIYFGGTTTTGGLLCNQLRAAGFDGPFLGPDGVFDPKLMEGCGANAGEIYVSFWFPPADATPELVAFDEEFRAATGEEQGPYTLEGKILVDFLLTAIDKAGTTDHEAVIDALHEITLESPLGTYKVDENGLRADPEMFIYKAEDGAFTYLP